MINVSLLFSLIVLLPVSLCDDFGLDTSVYKNLVEDMKKEGSKEDIFLKHMWPKIQEFFPSEAVVPAIEITYVEYEQPANENGEEHARENQNEQGAKGSTANNSDKPGETKTARKKLGESYTCQTQSKLAVKPKDITKETHKTYKLIPEKGKAQLEVDAELKIDRPFSFTVVVKTYDQEEPYKPTKMEYSFEGSNKVKIGMLIPDFSKGSTTAECLVVVTEINAIKFDEPKWAVPKEKDEKLRRHAPIDYFRDMDRHGSIYRAVSAGLEKAFIEKVTEAKKAMFGEKKTWICLSDELKNKGKTALVKRFTYGERYRRFCKTYE